MLYYSNSKITTWLLLSAFFVYLMIMVGGYTRLTHSGLSITYWKPISGITPPLNEKEWMEEFSSYKQSPEYTQINRGMPLAEFKKIFWVEYAHRVLGRLTALIFFIPFFFFFKSFSHQEKIYFSIIGILLLTQGLMGWLMVKSGLISMPSVSQYRLALHLSLACLILTLICWKLLPGKKVNYLYGNISIALLCIQIFSGALVAGLKAGLIYNSFPLMDGEIIPDGLFNLKPLYLNFFENVTNVQFFHRLLAYVNVINLLAYSYKIFNLFGMKKNAILLVIISVLQLSLGIITVMYQVPLIPALLHQGTAVILLITLVASLKKI